MLCGITQGQRTLVVRASTNVLANAAGFPVGREGPMVTIGSNLAFLLCHLDRLQRMFRVSGEKLVQPLVREWVAR